VATGQAGDATVAGRKPGIGRLDVAVVVACVVALAAMAVPGRREAAASAQRTEVNAFAGSVAGAAEFGHRLWQAQGGGATVVTARGAVKMVHGYPAAGELAKLLEDGEAMAFTHAGGLWRHRGVAGERCAVRYAPPARPGAAPEIERRLDGC
jgi:hypothetical protein